MTNIQITVFGKPGCQECRMTTRRLDKHGLPYVYRDVTEDPEAHAEVVRLGYQSLPVVTVGDVHWSRFRLAKLDRLAEIHAQPDVSSLDAVAERYLEDGAA
jgi:glutaredoxin-like protein NrdH